MAMLTNQQVHDQLGELLSHDVVDADAPFQVFSEDGDRPGGPETAYYGVGKVTHLVTDTPHRSAIVEVSDFISGSS